MRKERPATKAFTCVSCKKRFYTPKSLKHHPCPGRVLGSAKEVLPEDPLATLDRLQAEQ